MKKISLNLVALVLLTLSASAKNYIVNQKNKTFIPHELHLKVGDTITFKNSDDFAHNAYTDDEAGITDNSDQGPNAFDIGMQGQGEDVVVKMKAPSHFDIECAIHPNMLLEVTVE